MCGFSIVFQKQSITEQVYSNFLDSLRMINHRGPDDEGVVLINTKTNDFRIIKTEYTHSEVNGTCDLSSINLDNYNLILGHKRLSILDLSVSGHQPMQASNGSWIVFNGEIYNYIELKQELVKLGSSFNTHSDTEVILEAYRVWGSNCFNKFNGMWSICLWDAPHKQLVICNDRFGVKPLYYLENDNEFYLVSETKQLKCFNNIQLSINKDHLDDYLKFGYVDVDENTMYENVYRFKKSHCMIVDTLSYKKNEINTKQNQYYKVQNTKLKIDEKDAIIKFRELLYDAVKIRMRADVDFGFALSGGVDSSAILYMAKNIIKQEKVDNVLLGFSAIFPGYNAADESEFVKIVADDLPCKTVYSYPMNDFNFDAFEQHIYHQDEPVNGTSFFAQWSIYQKVKESGIKILFNGQGADEVFAGYHHHFYRYCRQLLIKGKLPQYFSLVNQYAFLKELPKSYIHQTVFNEVKLKAKMILGISKFDNTLLKYWHKIDTLDEMLTRDFDTFQIPTFLRADDRNGMAFSIESRHPFMDYRLVEFGYSLPNNLVIKNGWQKSIIRESMYEMPDVIRYRKDKKGFTTPQDIWLEKYHQKFEEYLEYNVKVMGTKHPSINAYKNYVLGAWLKVNDF